MYTDQFSVIFLYLLNSCKSSFKLFGTHARFSRMKTNFSTVSQANFALFSLSKNPMSLNALSLEVEVAGIHFC